MGFLIPHFAAKEFEQDAKIPCAAFNIQKKVGEVKTKPHNGFG